MVHSILLVNTVSKLWFNKLVKFLKSEGHE